MDVNRLRWAIQEAQERMAADPAFRWVAEAEGELGRGEVLKLAAEFIAHNRIKCPVGPDCRASLAVAWMASLPAEERHFMLLNAVMLVAELTERHVHKHPQCDECVRVEGKLDGEEG